MQQPQQKKCLSKWWSTASKRKTQDVHLSFLTAIAIPTLQRLKEYVAILIWS